MTHRWEESEKYGYRIQKGCLFVGWLVGFRNDLLFRKPPQAKAWSVSEDAAERQRETETEREREQAWRTSGEGGGRGTEDLRGGGGVVRGGELSEWQT